MHVRNLPKSESALIICNEPAITRHLKVLREAGLVQQRAEGARRFYSMRREALRTISDGIMGYHIFGEAGMDRLEQYVAALAA